MRAAVPTETGPAARVDLRDDVTVARAAGEVIEVGAGVTAVRTGQHVVISWAPACGDCADCVAGQPFLCSTFSAARSGVGIDGRDDTVELSALRAGKVVRQVVTFG